MEEIIKITERNGSKVVSARDLHAFLENTDNVNTWFNRQHERAMLVENEDFTRVAILQPSGQTAYDYALTLSSAKEIAMLNGGEKGKQARLYFIDCEKKLNKIVPRTHLEVLQSEMALLIEKERVSNELLIANKKIEDDKPKVVFAESVIGSSNSILVRQFAKDLCDDNFEIGQNRLYEWFRENKYLNQSNEPYQNIVAQGLFEVITRTIGSGTDTFTSKTTKVTGKGQIYFAEKIKGNAKN